MSQYDAYRMLDIEHDGEVLIVSLNRPDSLNAVNRELHRELSTIFRDIAADESVAAVVVTGRGRAFCAGGDINGGLPGSAGADLDRLFREARTIIIDLLELPQPIIAAVNGPAIGLGATIALFCDLTLMAADSVIADPHVEVGVSAGDGGAIIWPWLVGMKRAKEFLLTGDKVDAETAVNIGLANQVVAGEEVAAVARAHAHRLAQASTRALQTTKAALNSSLRATAVEVLDQSLASEKECFTSGDHDRAVAEFHARRVDQRK
jgi:enoyl-CoA hydratase